MFLFAMDATDWHQTTNIWMMDACPKLNMNPAREEAKIISSFK